MLLLVRHTLLSSRAALSDRRKKLGLSVLFDLAVTLYMIVGSIDQADKDKKKRIAKKTVTPMTELVANVHDPLRLDEEIDAYERSVSI